MVNTLDVMLHEADNQEQYGHWSWDTETLTRANGLQHVLTSFDFLMSLTTTANALASLRPLSIKLQRRSWDIVKAYELSERQWRTWSVLEVTRREWMNGFSKLPP